MLAIGRPFCDFLSFSVPSDAGAGVVERLRPILDVLGASPAGDGLWRVGSMGGTVKQFDRGLVSVFGVSGQVLKSMRDVGVFDDFIMAVAAEPHRVTRLDASCDFAVDSPAVIARFYDLAKRGEVSLSRKSVSPKSVQAHLAVDIDGRETGTVYLGGSHADVRGVLYDKRHERLCKGFSDIGPTLRVEIRLRSGVGCTIGDAHSPEAIFYHYAAPGLLELPPAVRSWTPHAEGFSLPQRQQFTAGERLQSFVERSEDLTRALDLAQACGPSGFSHLIRLVQQRVKLRENSIRMLLPLQSKAA